MICSCGATLTLPQAVGGTVPWPCPQCGQQYELRAPYPEEIEGRERRHRQRMREITECVRELAEIEEEFKGCEVALILLQRRRKDLSARIAALTAKTHRLRHEENS